VFGSSSCDPFLLTDANVGSLYYEFMT